MTDQPVNVWSPAVFHQVVCPEPIQGYQQKGHVATTGRVGTAEWRYFLCHTLFPTPPHHLSQTHQQGEWGQLSEDTFCATPSFLHHPITYHKPTNRESGDSWVKILSVPHPLSYTTPSPITNPPTGRVGTAEWDTFCATPSFLHHPITYHKPANRESGDSWVKILSVPHPLSYTTPSPITNPPTGRVGTAEWRYFLCHTLFPTPPHHLSQTHQQGEWGQLSEDTFCATPSFLHHPITYHKPTNRESGDSWVKILSVPHPLSYTTPSPITNPPTGRVGTAEWRYFLCHTLFPTPPHHLSQTHQQGEWGQLSEDTFCATPSFLHHPITYHKPTNRESGDSWVKILSVPHPLSYTTPSPITNPPTGRVGTAEWRYFLCHTLFPTPPHHLSQTHQQGEWGQLSEDTFCATPSFLHHPITYHKPTNRESGDSWVKILSVPHPLSYTTPSPITNPPTGRVGTAEWRYFLCHTLFPTPPHHLSQTHQQGEWGQLSEDTFCATPSFLHHPITYHKPTNRESGDSWVKILSVPHPLSYTTPSPITNPPTGRVGTAEWRYFLCHTLFPTPPHHLSQTHQQGEWGQLSEDTFCATPSFLHHPITYHKPTNRESGDSWVKILSVPHPLSYTTPSPITNPPTGRVGTAEWRYFLCHTLFPTPPHHLSQTHQQGEWGQLSEDTFCATPSFLHHPITYHKPTNRESGDSWVKILSVPHPLSYTTPSPITNPPTGRVGTAEWRYFLCHTLFPTPPHHLSQTHQQGEWGQLSEDTFCATPSFLHHPITYHKPTNRESGDSWVKILSVPHPLSYTTPSPITNPPTGRVGTAEWRYFLCHTLFPTPPHHLSQTHQQGEWGQLSEDTFCATPSFLHHPITYHKPTNRESGDRDSWVKILSVPHPLSYTTPSPITNPPTGRVGTAEWRYFLCHTLFPTPPHHLSQTHQQGEWGQLSEDTFCATPSFLHHPITYHKPTNRESGDSWVKTLSVPHPLSYTTPSPITNPPTGRVGTAEWRLSVPHPLSYTTPSPITNPPTGRVGTAEWRYFLCHTLFPTPPHHLSQTHQQGEWGQLSEDTFCATPSFLHHPITYHKPTNRERGTAEWRYFLCHTLFPTPPHHLSQTHQQGEWGQLSEDTFCATPSFLHHPITYHKPTNRESGDSWVKILSVPHPLSYTTPSPITNPPTGRVGTAEWRYFLCHTLFPTPPHHLSQTHQQGEWGQLSEDTFCATPSFLHHPITYHKPTNRESGDSWVKILSVPHPLSYTTPSPITNPPTGRVGTAEWRYFLCHTLFPTPPHHLSQTHQQGEWGQLSEDTFCATPSFLHHPITYHKPTNRESGDSWVKILSVPHPLSYTTPSPITNPPTGRVGTAEWRYFLCHTLFPTPPHHLSQTHQQGEWGQLSEDTFCATPSFLHHPITYHKPTNRESGDSWVKILSVPHPLSYTTPSPITNPPTGRVGTAEWRYFLCHTLFPTPPHHLSQIHQQGEWGQLSEDTFCATPSFLHHPITHHKPTNSCIGHLCDNQVRYSSLVW